MLVTTKAIVFSAIKYGDTSLIVKAFTASSGIKTYLLRGVLSSKKGKLKTAYFQPLTQLEIVANHRNKGTLETIREAKVYYHYHTLYADMAKNAMTLFLAELLANSIREEEQNEALFEFLEASLQWLDMNKEIANFHLYFILSLTKFLGFYPDVEHVNKPYFDLLEGEFTSNETLNPMLRGENIYYFKTFLGIKFDSINSIKMKKANRQELLKSIILYFELHLQGFRKPKSLAVLNEVFNTYV
ncbi:DNA repair protein RecO [Maribacter hydrothermalis]|uniref:DNA repair protein RecO n=1 Tax=Maribacter hydrothermalis TaxID=1836467 RepID=A0A1B7Z3X3_9FLAO|nr:DNA repair protein RecO [Maribacter hydrothermalis]APQ17127.1 DNA repair protein RecO [Maribacter hydrothermalis]OBR37388.1 DNA repair protein RecO [Maribacter hydrothermalis]